MVTEQNKTKQKAKKELSLTTFLATTMIIMMITMMMIINAANEDKNDTLSDDELCAN